MTSIEISSYAKINLTLEVGPKREDGYHEIDSVVQVIDLADRLVVEQAPEGVIEVTADAAGVPSGHENVVYGACRAFFESTGIRGGARFRIYKSIPAQAGLGGGSGNAAAAVVALNDMHRAGLPTEDLAGIAATVGSDAALFVYGGTVRMRGRGEIVDPLPDAPVLELLIVKPEAGVSTAWAYAELDRTSRKSRKLSDSAEVCIRTGDNAGLLRSLSNDFDLVVSAAVPEVARAKRALEDGGAQSVLLCGSGSAVFGVFSSREEAVRAGDSIKADFRQVFVARSLPR